MAGCSTLLVTVLIASVGEALPEIIHSIPKDSDSRLYGVEACGGWGWCVEADKKIKKKKSTLANYQTHEIPLQVARPKLCLWQISCLLRPDTICT